jgi:hypothetical protein
MHFRFSEHQGRTVFLIYRTRIIAEITRPSHLNVIKEPDLGPHLFQSDPHRELLN